MIIGKDVGLSYGGETTYGTAVTATTSLGIEATFSPTVTKTVLPVYGIGSGSNYTTSVAVALDYSAAFSCNFSDPTILRHAVGPLTGGGTNISSDPKILTEANDYSVSTSSGIQAATFKAKKEDATDGDVMDVYAGAYITDWTLTGGEGQIVQLNGNFVAQSFTPGTTIDNAYTELTTVPYIGAQSSLVFDSSNVANIMNWSVSMTNQQSVFRSINNADLEISQPVKSYRAYTVSITIRASQALVTTLIAEVNNAGTSLTKALSITMSKDASPGPTDEQCVIQLTGVEFSSFTEPISVTDDVVQITFNGIAKEGTSNIPIKWTD